ncbi:unnamed protein product [Closterium sp. Naga37s-1]|nr:unnamed protein product [Closterium sp. Naga37s-1]
MVPSSTRSGRPSLPFLLLVLLSFLLASSSTFHSPFLTIRAAAIGAQLKPAPGPVNNRDSNSTSVGTPLPRAWHPPLIHPVGPPRYAAHELLRSPRQRHVFGRLSAARLGVDEEADFPQPRRGPPDSALRGRSLAASAAADAREGECDAEWMLLWPAQECWRPRMTAQGGTSVASSSSHRLATAQSLTSAGAEIAQASAPAPTPSDGGGGDGGSAPPPGSEARLTPENEIIGVCRSGDPSTITIAPDWNGQTWHGWGTSLAWFANYVGKLPDDQFTLIMDLLFDKDKGIGLNLARYLIGGSVNYTNSPQFLTAAWETRSIPGFRVRPNGPYDWTADGQQRRTMLAGLARNVDEVEAVSYTPPWWMTVSGDTAGTVKNKCNLKPEFFQAYTEYQASVIEHYRTHWNVTFSTMNPANEALEGWWSQGSKNEGCNYNPQEMSTLIRLLTATLQRRKLPTKVAGFDSFVGATLRFTYKFPAAVKAGLFRFNVHRYSAVHGRGDGGHAPHGDRAREGGVGVGVKPLDLVISKKLYMLQQFVRGAPRGSLPLRIDTSDGCQHCIAAFFHPDQHFVSIFIANQRDTTHSATFQFRDFVPFETGQACVVETFRTSATENNTLLATQSYTDVPASIQVAALGSSFTSAVLRNVAPR